MANPNNPFGFRPIVRDGGIPYSLTQYAKPASDPNAIFMFDLVGHLTGGVPLPLAENPTYNQSRIRTASLLTPGAATFLGSTFAFGAASTGTVHPVTDEIDMIYNAQCSGALAITTALHAGLNANTLLTVGNLLNKQSAHQVDSATIAVTAGLDLKIQRISMMVPNQEGPNAVVEVMISKHSKAQGSASV